MKIRTALLILSMVLKRTCTESEEQISFFAEAPVMRMASSQNLLNKAALLTSLLLVGICRRSPYCLRIKPNAESGWKPCLQSGSRKWHRQRRERLPGTSFREGRTVPPDVMETWYSDEKVISAEDLKAHEAPTFRTDGIPEDPPPQRFCAFLVVGRKKCV